MSTTSLSGPRRSGLQTSLVHEQLLSDGYFFRAPDAQSIEEADRLANLGLVRLERVSYVKCFDILDRGSSWRTWGRECQGIIELNEALDEHAGQLRCPECDTPARTAGRRVHEGLRSWVLADGVILWIESLLSEQQMEVEQVARAAFRVVHDGRAAIATLFDFCDDARFVPGNVVAGARVLPVLVNSLDLHGRFAGQAIEPVPVAALLQDSTVLGRVISEMPPGGADIHSGMSAHERARRLSVGTPLTMHQHEHQAGSQYFEKVNISINCRAAEGSSSYGRGRFDDAVYFPATDEEHERLKQETTLLVDLRRRNVFYKMIEIPTRPVGRGRHLQNQALAVLAILALRNGEAIGETDLNTEIYALKLLGDDIGPRLSDIRRRIVGAFEDAVEGTSVTAKEVKRLVKVVKGMSQIMLQVKGTVRVIGLKKPTATSATEQNPAVQDGSV